MEERTHFLRNTKVDSHFDEVYHKDNYDIVYEILDSIDQSFVVDTADFEVATEYLDRGFFVNEHRIQKMMVKSGVRSTLIVTIEW